MEARIVAKCTSSKFAAVWLFDSRQKQKIRFLFHPQGATFSLLKSLQNINKIPLY